MSLEFVREEKIDIPGEEPADVEVYVLNEGQTKIETTDPFLTTDTKALPANLKRRATNYLKKSDTKSSGGTKQQYPEQLTAYDLLQVVSPPYDLDMLAKLYEMNAAHNAAVTMKAINIVGLGWDWVYSERVRYDLGKVQRTSPKKYETQLEKYELEKIELNEMIEDLCENETFTEVTTKAWTDVESLGNGYIEIGRNNSQVINYLGHIPGQTLRVRASRDGFIQMVANKYVFFRNFGDTDTPDPLGKDKSPNELIHIKKYSPNSTYYGVPDIIAALPATLGDKFAKEYNLDYFENKTVPRYAFILKGAKLSAKAEQTLVNYFKNELKGKHHGTLYVPIPAGFGQQVDAEFKAIEVGMQQASFMEYIKENRTEILMVHRVPPGKVGIHEKCVDEETEILTRDGWKTHSQLSRGDIAYTINKDLLGEWQEVEEVSRYSGKREMIRMQGAGHSSLTTPNHRWMVANRTGQTRFVETQNLKHEQRIPRAAIALDLPTEPKYADDFVELIAWFYTEGSRQRTAGISIGQNEGEYSDRIRACLTNLLGPEASRYERKNPGWRITHNKVNSQFNYFYINKKAKELLGIEEVCNSSKAPTPAFINSLTKSQLELFARISIYADGWEANSKTECQVDESFERISAIQMVYTLLGVTTTVNSDRNTWRLTVFKKGKFLYPVSSSIKDSLFSIERELYEGIVWCPTTKNGTWLARRNGTVYFTGNTNLAVSRDADKTFKEQVCGPEQERVEKKLNGLVKEFTKDFKLKFKEADLIDADIQSRIHDRYLRTQVLTPNDVLQDLGRSTRGDGNEPLPYMKGTNEGGPGQKTTDGAKPTRGTPVDATGQRQERGQAQDSGRQPNNSNSISAG